MALLHRGEGPGASYGAAAFVPEVLVATLLSGGEALCAFRGAVAFCAFYLVPFLRGVRFRMRDAKYGALEEVAPPVTVAASDSWACSWLCAVTGRCASFVTACVHCTTGGVRNMGGFAQRGLVLALHGTPSRPLYTSCVT